MTDSVESTSGRSSNVKGIRSRGGSTLLAVLFVAVLGAFGVGRLYYDSQRATIVAQKSSELSAIRDLKVDQIIRWKTELLADGEQAAADPAVSDELAAWLADPRDSRTEALLRGWVDNTVVRHKYKSAVLVATDGSRWISSTGGAAPNDREQAEVNAAAHSLEATMTDLYLDSAGKPQLDIVAPLHGTGTTVRAVLILRRDPNAVLYPLIQGWPTPSASSETLLVRRDGDHVTYLNELRFRTGAALRLTLPISRANLPAVMALSRQPRVVEGVDYRGHEVLAAIGPVPGLNWSIVAKIDSAEAYAALFASQRTTFIGVGLLVLAVALGLGLAWRQRTTTILRKSVAFERDARRSAQKYDELRRRSLAERNAYLESTNRIFEGALHATSEEELGAVCLDVAESVTGSAFGFIGEVNTEGTLSDIALSDPGWARCTMYDQTGHRRPPGDFQLRGLYGRVLLDGKGLYTNDPHGHADSIGTPDGHPALESFLGVPLMIGGHAVGIIAVANRPGGYGDDQLRELTALAPTVLEALHRRRAEVALLSRTEDLVRSNAELEKFAYVASHDLQEPLRMIASYTQLLQQRYAEKLGPEADEFIGYAVDGAKRMQTLINDLLAYSRVGSQGAPIVPTELEPVLEVVLRSLGPSIEEAGAIVTHDPMPRAMCDPTEIGQVFQNLVSNAIKFHDGQPPAVHIGVASGDGEWIFCIKDNGIGIAPEYFDRIFVIFQRLESRARYAGTGMGLAICKRIVERHGGRIWVESQPGAGSTFYFTLRDTGGE